MPLGLYEDFSDLPIKDLTNYLSVCGLNSSSRKVELVYTKSISCLWIKNEYNIFLWGALVT